MKLMINVDNGTNKGKIFGSFIFEDEKEKMIPFKMISSSSLSRKNLLQDSKGDEIIPFYIDEAGYKTPKVTGVVGSIYIPEDLVYPIVNKMDENNIDCLISYSVIKSVGTSNKHYNDVVGNVLVDGTDPDDYYIVFDYDNYTSRKVFYYSIINNLNRKYGTTSERITTDESFMMPYFVDEAGQVSSNDTGIIGGLVVPKVLILTIIEQLLTSLKISVKIGNVLYQEEYTEDIVLTSLKKEKKPTK